MPGIDQIINDRINAFAGQPQALAQRYAQNQDLLDLLALQKMKSDKTAAMREVQASMQANPATVRDQLNQEAMNQTRQEMATQAMQGAQGMQLNQRRAMAARGIPSLPAPNMARTQNFQQGGIIPAKPKPKPTLGAVPENLVGNDQIKQYAKEYTAIKRALEDPRQAEFKERNQLLLQDLIRQMGEQMPAVMQYIDSTKGFTEPRTKMFQEGGGVSSLFPVTPPVVSPLAASPMPELTRKALAYLAEKGIDAAGYTAEQLVALGRRLSENANAPSLEAMGAREAERESRAGGLGALSERVRMPEEVQTSQVADEQGSTLMGVLRGAAGMLGDKFSSLMPSERGGEPRPSVASSRMRGMQESMPNVQTRAIDPDIDKPRMSNEQLMEDLGIEPTSMGELLLGEPGSPGVPPSRRRMAMQAIAGAGGALFSGVPSVEELYPTSTKVVREGREPSAYEVGSTIREGVTSVPKALLGFLNPESGLTLSDVARPVADFGRGVVGLETRPEETPETQETATAAATTETTPAPRQAGLGALGDKVTALRGAPFRMEGVEGSGMRTPQDYLADVARRQAEQGTTAPEAATAEERPVSRYQEELDRLTARQEDPMRQLETFLSGIASGRGRGVGQSLAAGAQALRAAEDQIDARRLQLVEALQNEEITAAEAARESRRLDLMERDIEVKSEYNQQRVDLEQRVERLRAQGQLQEARAELIQGATDIFGGPLGKQVTRAEVEESNPRLSEAEINKLVEQRTQEKIQDYISSTAESSGLNVLATATTQTFMPEDEFAEEMTITE